MLDKSGILRRLALSQAAARQELLPLQGPELPGLAAVQTQIYRYVLAKFLLDDEPDPGTKSLEALSKLSVQKAGKLNPNEAELLDVSKHCGATSSAMTKKVLLLMSFREELGIGFTGYNTADIEDTDELGRIIYLELMKRQGRSDGGAALS